MRVMRKVSHIYHNYTLINPIKPHINLQTAQRITSIQIKRIIWLVYRKVSKLKGAASLFIWHIDQQDWRRHTSQSLDLHNM